MDLCQGHCRYLIAIYELNLTSSSGIIRSIDISRHLNVTRPSVSKMLKCMGEAGLVKRDCKICVELTEKGLITSRTLYKRYEAVYSFFGGILKLPDNAAKDQAILFISQFPNETVDKLAKITIKTLRKKSSEV